MPVLPILLTLLLAACGSTAPDLGADAGVDGFASRQVAAAEAERAAGNLAAALSRWRTLLLVPSEAARARTMIAELEPEIAARTREAVNKGEAAYARGNSREGDRWMLAALALIPAEETATASLRREFSARAVTQARGKIDSEYPPVITGEDPAAVRAPTFAALYQAGRYRELIARAKQTPPPSGSNEAMLLRRAHLQLANAASAGDRTLELDHLHAALAAQPLAKDPLLARVVALRGALSDEWLKTGSSLLQSDLEAAIRALEKSLHYNPGNHNASLRLHQARTLQRNLSRIQNTSPGS
ncbi:MAG: hypothetical protein RJQ10_05170 [Haliea sp.]|uniref:hypothetical protein n=1 Tax=Haliea sp. TaxID=1932666 RepID=UPI0032EC61B2